MPAKIQDATLTSRLVSIFGIKGRFRPELDDVVVPVVVARDLSSERVEVGPPTYQRGTVAGAVAGETGGVVFSSTSPNFLIAPRRVLVIPDTAGIFTLRANTTGISVVVTGPTTRRGVNKGEMAGEEAPVGPVIGTAAAWPGDNVGQYSVGTDGLEIDLTGWQVGQGEELILQHDTVNDAVRVLTEWTWVRAE